MSYLYKKNYIQNTECAQELPRQGEASSQSSMRS